ncbi:MAG: pyridine nucleotide-disulfide oxidoreductase [Burkholderiaceae bacterium]|nr:pyridine nucleotide-disulfide oxidoreductase [Burkholderiaceae bacterium]
MSAPIVIIGAGQSGLQVAEALRAEGWEGDVIMLGEEPVAPYHRPPLSKAYLLGESSAEQLTMRTPEVLARKNITLRTGIRVERIDPAAKTLHFSHGSSLPYHRLAIATGARVRPLPGADLQGVFGLRTLDDCTRISEALNTAQDVVVIGGGFIGLEFAAVARKKEKTVTVLEAADRLMARAVSPIISALYVTLHTQHGVALKLGVKVTGFTSANGRVSGVTLADGGTVKADLVVVGIGVLPNQELAAAAGLACEGGIIVDACGRTSDPFIFASGDCAAMRLDDGSLRRLESVQNAVEQGKAAAAAIMGKEKPFIAAPWFWSDQYDVKLQMVGTSAGHDQAIVRGDQAGYKCSIFYYRQGVMIGMDSLNRPQDHMAGRKLLDQHLSPTPQQAADEGFALNSLLQQQAV